MWDTFKIFTGKMANESSHIAGSCLAAFFGATCAMSFQRWRENQKRITEEHGAIVRCQMALIAQHNTLSNIKEQYLDLYRNCPARERKLIHFRMCDAGFRVTYDSLSFLLTKSNPNLLLDVHSAEQSYISSLEVLVWRNEAYVKIHENSTLENIDPKTGACFVALKDIRDLVQLKTLTDALYKTIDNACDRLDLQTKELEKAGKLLYPKMKFLSATRKMENQSSPSSRPNE
jgi:hypothetical protein